MVLLSVIAPRRRCSCNCTHTNHRHLQVVRFLFCVLTLSMSCSSDMFATRQASELSIASSRFPLLSRRFCLISHLSAALLHQSEKEPTCTARTHYHLACTSGQCLWSVGLPPWQPRGPGPASASGVSCGPAQAGPAQAGSWLSGCAPKIRWAAFRCIRRGDSNLGS